MVYESDFYTTRRPYTRPISSHYTVTNPGAIITPMPPLQQQQHFDDEAREIRARADSLLRRIHVFIPRPSSSDFAEVIVPERMRSDDYIRRVLTARKNAKKDEEYANYYESPDTRHFGSGNLAGVSYTGGKPHSRRRPYYKLNDLRAADVQSDVNLLSYYAKNRQAAASAYPDPPLTERELRKARALADDGVYAPPRKASPDPEPIYKPDLATVYEPEEVVERKPKKAIKAEKKTKVHRVIEREPIAEIKPEPIVEPESIVEPEPVVEPKPIAESETETIVEQEPESSVQSEPEPEPVVELESEPVIDPELESKQTTALESELKLADDEFTNAVDAERETESEVKMGIPETTQDEVVDDDYEEENLPAEETAEESPIVPTSTEETDAQNDDNELNDENQEDDEVLQRKLDDEELRRQVEELKRQAEETKRRQAEEARLADERYKAEIEERVRLEEEARQARFREIEEQERLEAERQAEEIRIETERIRDLKIAEEEKRAVEREAVLALEEEERFIIEKVAEDARKRQEREEKLASEVVLGEQDEDNAPESTFDECHCHDNTKSQEHEERPDSPDADDDTQIEEEAGCISTDHDELSENHPYDGEHEGFNSVQELDTPIENIPKIDEIDSDESNES